MVIVEYVKGSTNTETVTAKAFGTSVLFFFIIIHTTIVRCNLLVKEAKYFFKQILSSLWVARRGKLLLSLRSDSVVSNLVAQTD